ncbi:hypothetical protein DFS34DRAFT_597990 [Phlyctochytrium arcticum]|nr:hypothetical protein DFS34DRAFT_597990 [Phlyctochytrium arcticum]
MRETLAKFVYKGTIRQVVVQENQRGNYIDFQTIHWNDLVTRVRLAFRMPEHQQFSLNYEDSEKDIIEVDTDVEFKRAVTYFRCKPGAIRFMVRDAHPEYSEAGRSGRFLSIEA